MPLSSVIRASVVGAIFSAAQAPAPLSTNVRLVRVPVLAFDKTGVAMTGLNSSDFSVFDDGAPQEVTTFWKDSDAPLTVALVLDTSGSQLPHLIENKQVLIDFLQIVLRPQDKAFLEVFDTQPRLAVDTTSSAAHLSAMLSRFSRLKSDHPHYIGTPMGQPCRGKQPIYGAPCGNSVVWNAVTAAAQKLSHAEGRRVIVLLTDGEDSGSDVSFKDTIKAAQSAEAAVFPMGWPDPFHRRINHGELERLAKATGGRAMLEQKDARVDFTELNEELRSEYVLAFKPEQPEGSGKTHTLEVRVPKAYRVRARTAYTDTAPSTP
jgi:VWFA-related protein